MRINAPNEGLHVDHVPRVQVCRAGGQTLVKRQDAVVGQPIELRLVIDLKPAELGRMLQVGRLDINVRARKQEESTACDDGPLGGLHLPHHIGKFCKSGFQVTRIM